MDITITDLSLLRLMQLTSPALPVGGFSFSQGLEYAIEANWVTTEKHVEDWLQQQLNLSLASLDVPVLMAVMEALMNDDQPRVLRLNDFSLACRETAELRLTETAMGDALRRLLTSLAVPQPFIAGDTCSFVVLFAVAAQHWQVEKRACALGFLWAWLENQMTAATKLVPLGQTQAQQLLGRIQQYIPGVIERAESLPESQWGLGLPGLAMASSLHELQYSRLFRS